ncbi:hypothetical protein CH370_21590 [Leptospira kmetyi]|nr:hypothetical protein CH370_21590 [Leptospira kmetyi]
MREFSKKNLRFLSEFGIIFTIIACRVGSILYIGFYDALPVRVKFSANNWSKVKGRMGSILLLCFVFGKRDSSLTTYILR